MKAAEEEETLKSGGLIVAQQRDSGSKGAR